MHYKIAVGGFACRTIDDADLYVDRYALSEATTLRNPSLPIGIVMQDPTDDKLYEQLKKIPRNKEVSIYSSLQGQYSLTAVPKLLNFLREHGYSTTFIVKTIPENIREIVGSAKITIMSNESILKTPRAFISYSWDDDEYRKWVHDFAARLRGDGVDVTLDQWHLAPGDQLASFMEQAVRENDFVIIICTPRYKEKSDGRIGGVGYEGDIMTAEVNTKRNHRKFIPVLRKGDWFAAAPSWLSGKVYLDLRGDIYLEESYQDLLRTLHRQRPQAPPVGRTPEIKAPEAAQGSARIISADQPTNISEPIRIKGIKIDEVTAPRNDGTRGSGLYAIPFQLSRRPSAEWAELFVRVWDHPPQYTTMHRPRIASVTGDRIILDGTTIEEVEKYHQDTLKLVVDQVNEMVAASERARQEQAEAEKQGRKKHEDELREISKRLKFD